MNYERQQHASFAITGAIVVALCIGCGQSGPKLVKVRGKVTLQSRPLVAGVVTFQPLDKGVVSTRRPSIGVIESDGIYRISTFVSYDGAEPGEYLVSVDGSLKKAGGTPQSIDPDALLLQPSGDNVPLRYLSPQTSGLRTTVPADAGEANIDFALVP